MYIYLEGCAFLIILNLFINFFLIFSVSENINEAGPLIVITNQEVSDVLNRLVVFEILRHLKTSVEIHVIL